MPVHLNQREVATVLAALRHWQHDLANNQEGPISEHFDDHITPFTVEEIDRLCELLNCG